MRAFDFIADDRFTIPDHERQLYVEEVLEIPRRATFPPPRHSPPVTPSPRSLGRPFTFGHLGRLAKVTDETLAIWRRVLLGVPGSRLVLKADVEAAGSRFRQVLDRLKADVAADRISVIGPKDRLANMADYGAIDLTLDTTPLAGPLTVWESLWMGVPAVALRGTTQSARASVSILASCGMEAFVADDAEAYVAVALRAACVPSTLIPLRAELRGRLERSEACDPHRAAASMSEALRTAWRRRCARRDRAFPSGKADRPRSAP
jgi:protein O-GlcNAc transferase